MVKRVKRTSKFALQKCDKRHHDLKDRIDRLPDDILVSILSLLTMKDAARTSVLSHRWRYLWTFITGALEFDESKMVYEMLMGALIGSVHKSLEVERRRFVNWVNQVLRSHRASTLDGFKVCFDMDDSNSCKSLIDGWLNFAIQKRVKWLELDFSCSSGYLIRGNYALNPQFFSQFDSLTSLRLNCLDVTGEAVEYFISKCPFLEVLCVITSKVLVNLKICGPSLKLKYLEISHCHYLETMEIFALDLVSFIYSGPKISIPRMNVPSLHEVSLGGPYGVFGFDYFCQLSSSLSLLTTLKLDLSIEQFTSFPKFPKLGNLKHLELSMYAMGCHSLLHCHSLLKAFPSLNRLVLKLTGLDDVSKQEKVKVRKLICPYQCLKVVEFVGFVGVKIDFELALHILKNSVSLEKIIIDTRCPFTRNGWDFEDTEKKLAAITRARGLETRLPPGVELVILNV